MKFVAEIDELFGARRAGYVFDEKADRERDEMKPLFWHRLRKQ